MENPKPARETGDQYLRRLGFTAQSIAADLGQEFIPKSTKRKRQIEETSKREDWVQREIDLKKLRKTVSRRVLCTRVQADPLI